jgi:hypothetical protein
MKWSEKIIQIALTQRGNIFDFTRYSSVPNVSYALLYRGEADLICMSSGHVFHEVEIKISIADMKNEAKKYRPKHGGYKNYIAYKWIAAPWEIVKCALELPCIPVEWGVVSVCWNGSRFGCSKLRNPKRQKTDPVPDSRVEAFYRTGLMRMWSHREKDISEFLDS